MELKDVKCFLLDMDGTFYLGNQLIDGSLSFIDKVVSSGRDFMFLTNNSSHNANFYVQKLAKMGLNIDRSKVMTSGEATCEKINELYPGKRAFVLGNEFLLEEFKEAGIPVDNENPEIVVIGFDTTLTYQKMWDVCNFVRAGPSLYRDASGFQLPDRDGLHAGHRRDYGLHRSVHRPSPGSDRLGQALYRHCRSRAAQNGFEGKRAGNGGRPPVYGY